MLYELPQPTTCNYLKTGEDREKQQKFNNRAHIFPCLHKQNHLEPEVCTHCLLIELQSRKQGRDQSQGLALMKALAYTCHKSAKLSKFNQSSPEP
uniref:Uncharacterized protein n=1 Tax=Rhizophora mucronata TaxID=61149 RepID=A0A2P2KWI1_RHIMU